MKNNIGKHYRLFVIGMFLLSFAIIIKQTTHLPDSIKGALYGASIGLMLLPSILKRQHSNGVGR